MAMVLMAGDGNNYNVRQIKIRNEELSVGVPQHLPEDCVDAGTIYLIQMSDQKTHTALTAIVLSIAQVLIVVRMKGIAYEEKSLLKKHSICFLMVCSYEKLKYFSF